jgi:hypothetical protein
VAQRSPTAFRPNLNFLKQSALNDQSSASELAKFGFSRDTSSVSVFSDSNHSAVDAPADSRPDSDGLKLGFFCCISDDQRAITVANSQASEGAKDLFRAILS